MQGNGEDGWAVEFATGPGPHLSARAAVITFSLSLMLRNNVVAERQSQNSPQLLDFVDCPDPEPPKPGPPNTPAEAVAAFARLRS